jgi:hypothetical protein
VLLGVAAPSWIAAAVLLASTHTAWSIAISVILFLAGTLALIVGLRLLDLAFRPKPKPFDPEIARMFARSGSFFERPKPGPSLRRRL